MEITTYVRRVARRAFADWERAEGSAMIAWSIGKSLLATLSVAGIAQGQLGGLPLSIPDWVPVAVFALLVLIVAPYSLWRDEKGRADKAEQELEARYDLAPQIRGAHYFENQMPVEFIVRLTVRNEGKPTTGELSAVQLKPAGADRWINGHPRKWTQPVQVTVGTSERTFDPSDNYVDKSVAKPIPEGGQCPGHFLVRFAGVPYESATADGAVLAVEVADITGGTYRDEYPLRRGGKQEMMHFPGMG